MWRLRQSGTQRHHVIGCVSILDVAFGCSHRLIRKPLQPQNPREEGACCHSLIDLKSNAMRFLDRREIVSEHALELAPRAEQIAEVILRRTDHSLADQPIVRVGPLRRQSIESLSQG